jgi:glycosyltransferase involved in cell wall biosynthesis
MKIALAAAVRNEELYLLEWIAFHKALGVNHFIIVNNGSDDGTEQLLKKLGKTGIVSTHNIYKNALQLEIYQEIIKNYQHDFDWIGFLDIDEFFVPENNKSINEILGNQPKECGGVAVNWAIYGSSYQPFPDSFTNPSPTTARFSWRAKKTNKINSYFKVFVKPQLTAINTALPYSHAFPLVSNDYFYTNCKGTRVALDALNPVGQLPIVNWEGGRINHYLVRSKWEYKYIKCNRGSFTDLATATPRFLNWIFFDVHDRNEVFDPLPLSLAQLRDQEMEDLSRKLALIEWGPRHEIVNETKPDNTDHFTYTIEEVFVEEQQVLITGWVIDVFGRSPIHELELQIRCNNKFYHPVEITIKARPDIVQSKPNAYLNCGFTIKFEPIHNIVLANTIDLYFKQEKFQTFELPIRKYMQFFGKSFSIIRRSYSNNKD